MWMCNANGGDDDPRRMAGSSQAAVFRAGVWENGLAGMVAGVVVMILMVVGCARTRGTMIERVQDGEAVHIGGATLDLSGGSAARVRGDWVRVIEDLPRAAERLEWVEVRLEGPPRVGTGREDVAGVFLMPDGREAVMSAARGDGSEIGVRLRVGRFGDREMEARFIEELAQVLRGRPVLRRLERYRLPW